jgi:hypothetical protein
MDDAPRYAPVLVVVNNGKRNIIYRYSTAMSRRESGFSAEIHWVLDIIPYSVPNQRRNIVIGHNPYSLASGDGALIDRPLDGIKIGGYRHKAVMPIHAKIHGLSSNRYYSSKMKTQKTSLILLR